MIGDNNEFKNYYADYKDEDIFNKLLEAREERAGLITNLSHKYKKTIICIRANYPGLYKINQDAVEIVNVMKAEAEKIFKGFIINSLYNVTYEGPVTILAIDKASKEVKRETVKIEENHSLGRLVDIDVYDEMGIGISREEVEVPRRKCFLCENEAHNCVRSKAHTEVEVKEYINKLVKEFRNMKLHKL